MKEVGTVNGRKRSGHFQADQRGLMIAEGTLRDEQRGERLAVDKVGPEADASIVAVAAIDGDDVGVLHARKGPGFTKGRLVLGFRIERAREQEFEGNLALEVGVPGAIDLAEAAGADAVEELEASPGRLQRRGCSLCNGFSAELDGRVFGHEGIPRGRRVALGALCDEYTAVRGFSCQLVFGLLAIKPEARMHGHVTGVMGQEFPVGASQVASEKAALLQRAAAVRRRLLREAAELGVVLDGDAEELVAAWKGSGDGQRAVSYWV